MPFFIGSALKGRGPDAEVEAAPTISRETRRELEHVIDDWEPRNWRQCLPDSLDFENDD